PLGMVLNGPAGSGKTHLISSLRQSLIDRAFFVLVDMTDVKSFWNTVRQGYLESITHDGLYQGNNRRPQYEAILLNLLSQIPSVKNPEKTLKSLSEVANTAKIAEYADKVLFGPLHRQYRSEISKYKDVLRALLLLNSRSFEISDVGYSWLQGIDQDESTKKSYGFHWHTANPHLVVEGLSWAMSLVAPTLLAFDQMDAIVAQHHIATAGAKSAGDMTEEQAASAAIIHELAGGLMAIRDTSFRTLSLVSCLSHTWEILKNEAVRSFEDRFQLPAFNLSNIRSSEIAARIIRKRVERAAAETQLPLPDSPWPFSTQALSQILMSPRELLKNCHQSRQLGLRQGQYSELSFESDAPTSAPPTNDALSSLDKQFLAFQQDADLEALNNLKNEDSLMDELIESGCRSLIRENPLPDNMDLLLDEDFSLKNGRPTLHARLRMVLHSEHDREQHYSFRVIQQTSGVSLQSRLRAAMTASGIDRKLSFRSLIIVRTLPLPNGPATRRLWEEFLSNGGIHINPTETEWRILFALRTMEQVKPDGFEDWLLARKPASKLALFKRIELTSEHAKSNPPVESPTKVENLTAAINNIVNTRQPGTNSGAVTNPEPNPTTNPEPTEPLTIDPNLIPVGRRLIGTEQKEILGISLENLIKHTVVLASSGSGKTVLVRRMIEEAALLGIPSIVIDPANDLARLGDKWPVQPASWSEADVKKAERYFNEVDVKIWTPGKESGRPFKLAPMPDFSELQQDPDELEAALLLSLELLKGMLLSGKSNTNEVKAGLLMGCLRYMAHQGESGLAYLIELLKEMPPEATGGISGASKHGVSMANQLIAQCMSDPLLRGSADPV
ncbi:MAG: helicase HerA domain-containing protein, partial [Oceanobacter sp.]